MLHHSPLLPRLHFLGPGDPKETHALSAETHACHLESNLKKKCKFSLKKLAESGENAATEIEMQAFPLMERCNQVCINTFHQKNYTFIKCKENIFQQKPFFF